MDRDNARDWWPAAAHHTPAQPASAPPADPHPPDSNIDSSQSTADPPPPRAIAKAPWPTPRSLDYPHPQTLENQSPAKAHWYPPADPTHTIHILPSPPA